MKIVTIDFETYSEAGCDSKKTKKGLDLVGAAVYSEHPSTDIICLSYSFGSEIYTWFPNNPLPQDLFDHIKNGGLIEAWNVGFERWIWKNVAVRKYDFSPVDIDQWRCCASRSRAFAYPGSLKTASTILKLKNGKFDGAKLLNKFSIPDKKRGRRYIQNEPEGQEFIEYNIQDVRAEMEAASILPELSKSELSFWKLDQSINDRGIGIDVELLNAANDLIPKIYDRYNKLTEELTNGFVTSLFQVARISAFCEKQGVHMPSVKQQIVLDVLKQSDLPDCVRKLLEYRLLVKSTTVAKIPAMKLKLSKDNRIYDNFVYYAAHTGRFSGRGVQVQNMPQGDSSIIESARPYILSGDMAAIENKFGDVITLLKNCLRGFIKSRDGHEFICSDFSSIEAVILAAIAGADWRIEVFRTHGMIYELSASRMLGIPFEEFVDYKKQNGHHHPKRQLGKVFDLSMGYGGSLGAYRTAKDSDASMPDVTVLELVKSWRTANPEITKLWHGLQRCFVQSIMNEGVEYKYRKITYKRLMDMIVCTLPSGRQIVYHRPRLINGQLWYSGAREGAWIEQIKLHGGVLTENVIQAIARDVLIYAAYKLEKTGYPIVLHVHDEIMAEVPVGFGSVEEFENIMSTLPRFCVYDDGKPWPIFAKGGWRGERFGKY